MSKTLALRDVLSHLTYAGACRLLGPSGAGLLRKGGQREIDIQSQVTTDQELFRLELERSVVEIHMDDRASGRIGFSCSSCSKPCEHLGAAFSLILEEKLALDLATPPSQKVPLEALSDAELVERALAERAERARTERLSLAALDGKGIWSDYAVSNAGSGKTYRVALRGWQRGDSYCSCPDFRTNTLGTCKHIIFALATVKRKFSRVERSKPYRRTRITLHVGYGEDAELRLLLPEGLPKGVEAIVAPLRDGPILDARDLMTRIRRLEQSGWPVNVYPDAEEMVNALLASEKLEAVTREIRKDPKGHALRKSLLKVELLPYQLDGIAFAAGVGRAIIADDMGLGKTLQGIGTAELLAREAGISRVLIVCPASLKSQWALEIRRATDRAFRIVTGSAGERAEQYRDGVFFTIVNYEQVLRDIPSIERARWDFIILDEGQRIKNWQARTAQTIKALQSPYALVLSGTPLENRLDELYSVVQFIDTRRLGPAFRFFHRHRVADEKGRILGYKNLDLLRERLSPILIRRTRAMVLKQLPPRTTEILRIPPTAEQADMHDGHKRTISTILSKKYISEMDLLRLQKALLMCRMTADSTFLVDKEAPGYSTKLTELDALLERLAAESDRKIIVFSEWTTMLDLIEPLLKKRKIDFVRLDGSVPQAKRQPLVDRFQRDRGCPVFLATNAGSTGLNLQAADTVINVDLPWNPAILEQRIARAHRMGQRRPVTAYLLVTEGTIEENMLSTLSIKKDLFLAALDPESPVKEISLSGGIEELKRKLEVLVGEKPPATAEADGRLRVEEERRKAERSQAVALAGGELLTAAFAFTGKLLGSEESAEPESRRAFRDVLSQCLEKAEGGGWRMTVAFPDEAALDAMAGVLSGVLTRAGRKVVGKGGD